LFNKLLKSFLSWEGGLDRGNKGRHSLEGKSGGGHLIPIRKKKQGEKEKGFREGSVKSRFNLREALEIG